MSDVVQRYRRDGFVVVPQVVDEPTMQAWRAHLATFAIPANGVVPLHLPTDAVARHMAEHVGLSALAMQLLGGPTKVFGITYVVKAPQSPWQVSWHQDGEPWRRQWGIEQAITLWVALDDAGAHNGGLRMIPGSHRQALRALEPVETEFDVFGWASPPAIVDESKAVTVELAAGDVSAHHPAMVHASHTNPSRVQRRAISLRLHALDRYAT